MSPRPSSAARVTDEPDDFEWPPTADELSVYDVGPDPWHSVHVAAGDAFQARRRESPARPAVATHVPGITSRPAATRVSRGLVAAIAAALAIAAIAGWNYSRATPLPVPVETVHHPAPPAAAPPPRLRVVATYQVDPPASAVAPAGDRAAVTAPVAGRVDAPGIPVAPAAAHHALAGVASVAAPGAPVPATAAARATPQDAILP